MRAFFDNLKVESPEARGESELPRDEWRHLSTRERAWPNAKIDRVLHGSRLPIHLFFSRPGISPAQNVGILHPFMGPLR